MAACPLELHWIPNQHPSISAPQNRSVAARAHLEALPVLEAAPVACHLHVPQDRPHIHADAACGRRPGQPERRGGFLQPGRPSWSLQHARCDAASTSLQQSCAQPGGRPGGMVASRARSFFRKQPVSGIAEAVQAPSKRPAGAGSALRQPRSPREPRPAAAAAHRTGAHPAPPAPRCHTWPPSRGAPAPCRTGCPCTQF